MHWWVCRIIVLCTYTLSSRETTVVPIGGFISRDSRDITTLITTNHDCLENS